MHLDFVDETLRRLAFDETFLPAGWGDEEICHFRLVAQCVQAAEAESDVRATRVLRLQACHDGEPGMPSVQLSAHRRLLLVFKNGDVPPAIAMFSVLQQEAASKEMEDPK